MQLIGLVLCGGKSERMGFDKGLLKCGDKTWAQIAITKLKVFVGKPILSVSEAQQPIYRAIFPDIELIVDKISIKGPLAGLISTHLKYPKADILVLACDLIDMNPSLIDQLYRNFLLYKSEAENFVYSINTEVEPLLGIYSSTGLRKIYTLLIKNELTRHSMKYVLEIGNTKQIQLNFDEIKYFKNYNTKEDFNQID